MPALFSGSSIVFDLDGTLVDTAPDLAAAMNHVLAERGLPPAPMDQVRHLTGFGARRLIDGGLRHGGSAIFNETEMDQAVEDFLGYYQANIADHSKCFPGAEDCLEELLQTGAKLAVCTNKREALAVQLLKELGLEDVFGAIIGADTLSVKKPDPAPFHEAVRLTGANLSKSVMIGDSLTDIKTARAAGRPVIAVSFGYSDVPPESLEADILVTSFSEMTKACRKLLER